MRITEIRIKLMAPLEDRRDKLKAFCSVTLDDEIVIRDLKIIEGNKGLFVAMPSRKLMGRCHGCGCKNSLRARFCNECGRVLGKRGPQARIDSRKLYADVAHPINAETRGRLQESILAGYHEEIQASRQKGYVAPRFDDLDYDEPVPLRKIRVTEVPGRTEGPGRLEAGNQA